MDSATVLGLARQKLERDEIVAISINYGQRHQIELEHATQIAKHYQIEHQIIDLSSLKQVMKGNSQTDESVPVPHGHYEAETMKATVVPNRNMILLAVAAAAAISRGWKMIYYGAHAGDHAIYPDCRPPFIRAMRETLRVCHYFPLSLEAPYAYHSKQEIVKEGAAMKVPYDLTYSCYEGGPVQCGKCGTCQERREAFINAGVTDPTVYKG